MNKKIFNNIRYSLVANAITMVISIILTLLIPKSIGMQSYGYYQLYLFYVSFVGFFHFGIVDGIYLKIGGSLYEEIDKQSIGSQFWYLILFNTLILFLVVPYSLFKFTDTLKIGVILLTCLSSILINSKTLLLFVLQCTNRIKEYAKYTRIDRIIFFIFCIIYIIFGGKQALLLIFLDVLSRMIVLILMILRMNDLVIRKLTPLKYEFIEIIDNIKIGLNLTLSYLASQLIIGIVRLGIEIKWSIEVFGQISLTLSISNMVMTFINAVSAIMFPLLRRAKQTDLTEIYKSIRFLFIPFLFCLLLIFQPLKYILEIWLPDYEKSIEYMGILFPIFIYESKVSLLTNTYLKTLRLEKEIFKVNALTLLLSVISTILCISVFSSIKLAVLSILLLLVFKSNMSETILSRHLSLSMLKTNVLEFLLTMIFVISTIFMKPFESIIIYGIFYLIYLFLNISKIKNAVRWIKKNNN